jgi:predicted phage terminase large subunit-like protein
MSALPKIDPEFLERFLAITNPQDRLMEYQRYGRHKARTDLLWLARNILGMKKMQDHVHGPIANFLQKFDGHQGTDAWVNGGWQYTPLGADPADVIPDPMPRRLILAPRSWFKTSLNVIAHSVQILLNFPDATIHIMHASGDTAEDMLGEIKRAFHENSTMRYFFPEFCSPLDKNGATKKEFGKQGEFDLPNRKRWTTAPSCSVSGIESSTTGMHYHVIKFTDIVDVKNTATKDLVEKIVQRYGMARNLLIAPRHWIDIEGTRYHFSDLYGRIIDVWHEVEKEIASAAAENRAPLKKHTFRIFAMGCYKKDLSGTGRTTDAYTPDELELPYLLVNGQKVSRFPEEWSVDALEALRTDDVTGEGLFASQQLNNPVETEAKVFSLDDLLWKHEDDMKKVPFVYVVTTVDMAETTGKRADFTTITTAGVDRTNRRYILDIRHGKWLADQVIDELFTVQLKYRPYKIKVEETGFVRGLKGNIQRRSELTGIWPNFEYLPRDNQIAKTARIQMTLQPQFRQKLIYFNAGLDDHVKEQLKHELTRFPKYSHDDILDTLADLFTNEPVMGDIKPNKTMAEMLIYAQQVRVNRAEEYTDIYGPKVEETDRSWSGLGAL